MTLSKDEWSAVHKVRPGDEIELTGIYSNSYDSSLNTKNGFPIFATVIIANHVVRNDEKAATDAMTEDDIKAINALSKDERIGERIIARFVGNVYIHAVRVKIIPCS